MGSIEKEKRGRREKIKNLKQIKGKWGIREQTKRGRVEKDMLHVLSDLMAPVSEKVLLQKSLI